MDLQLKDKTALVTGASTGIGRSIALALAAEGVHVAISARRVNLLAEVAEQIVAAGGQRPVIIESDLYAEDAAQRLTSAAMAGLGHVDILVNNAGGLESEVGHILEVGVAIQFFCESFVPDLSRFRPGISSDLDC